MTEAVEQNGQSRQSRRLVPAFQNIYHIQLLIFYVNLSQRITYWLNPPKTYFQLYTL